VEVVNMWRFQATAGKIIMDVIARRSSDAEIDWNIFQAPPLAFGDLARGALE